MLRIAILCVTSAISGCACPPQRWAEELEQGLVCDMSIAELESLSHSKLDELEFQIFWTTHIIKIGRTEILFGYKNGKLKFSQIAWEARMTRMATFQRVDWCG